MGLDMYVFKISALTEEEKELVDALQEPTNYPAGLERFTIRTSENDDNTHLVKNVLPWMYLRTISTPYFDYKKMLELIGAPEDARLGMVGGNTYHFYKDGKDYSLNVDTVEDREIITTYNDTLYGFCHSEELCYWRKNYKLQEALYAACEEEIENCGYYPLNDEMRRLICRDNTHGKEHYRARDLKPKSPSEVICYHEWY